MKNIATFTLSILLSTSIAFGQTRIITGKVIFENFYPAYQAKVFTVDTLVLVTADTGGNFKIEIPIDMKLIMVGAIGAEWKNIDLSSDCNNLDILLLNRATYDFMSAGKVDRLRKKDFKKLPALYKSTFEKGIFKTDRPCYVEKFIPIKKRLKEIHRQRAQMPST
jgi:hypothetical protein